MRYKEEIAFRNEILSRIRNGKKITPDERLWLETHRVINQKLGFPYLNTDIIELDLSVTYNIRVRIESCPCCGRYTPIFGVPSGMGWIIANNSVVDYKGELSIGKKVKIFGFLCDSIHCETEFKYKSSLGLLSISYECEYYDEKQNLTIRKASNTGDPRFAMNVEILSQNKNRYSCRVIDSDSSDCLVFTVTWVKAETNQGTVL